MIPETTQNQYPAIQEPKAPSNVRISLTEEGVSGLKEMGGFVQEAYHHKLFWPQVASEYARIRTSTPAIVMTAHQFTAWARSIKPVVNLPDKPTDDDKRYKDFRESDFDNMEGGFSSYIETALGRVPFDGWYWWDVCLSRRDPNWTPPNYIDSVNQSWPDDWRSEEDDGLIGIRRLAPRDNSSFFRWDFNGAQRAIGMYQRDPKTGKEIRLDKKKSLHHTFGDPNNPEGNAGLQPCWRLERLQYGLQVVYGIGAEHTAGYLKFTKTEKGDISTQAERLIGQAAKYMLTAQEGNYSVLPFGFDAALIESAFTSAPALLEAIKNFDVLMLSVFGMQWMALNTLTGTGSYAAQTDVTNSGITSFNAMLDGFARQYDDQIERRIFELNRSEFPNITKRPRVSFSHLENAVPLQEISSFFSQMKPIMPMGKEDIESIRRLIPWLPDNSPEPEDVLNPDGTTGPQEPKMPPNSDGEIGKEAAGTSQKIRQALGKMGEFMSRRNNAA